MASSNDKVNIKGFARKLVSLGLLKEAQAAEASDKASKEKIPFVSYLVSNGMVSSRQLAVTASTAFGLPFFDLFALDLDSVPQEQVDVKLVEKHHALPIFLRGNRLFVAISDPTNLDSLDEIKFQSGYQVEGILVEEDKLHKVIEKVLSLREVASLGNLEEEGLDNVEITTLDSLEEDNSNVEDAPIVKFVNKVILDAINTNASDIHFEPFEKVYRVRVRQDGILHEYASPPIHLSHKLSARLKVISSLDISERRVPQDGRFKMNITKKRAIDFRVSTCPTLFGEKVVMRILDPSHAKVGIDALGYEPKQKELFLEAIHKPQGMVIVTGPTGSGKTVSLYTALGILNTQERNISTCEDPVEIYLEGINQVNVNPKAGLDFAMALRAFLRQDPDIIMVGEIRDLETAEIAVKASQTGHMVLSTLHTNSAADSLTRLINMGVPAYNLATSISLVIAQRLTRKLCQHCKIPRDIPKNALLDIGFREDELDDLIVYGPKGCDRCSLGYKGRIGIYEVLPVTNGIGRIIMEGGNAIAIYDQATQEGMWDLRRSGLEKVKRGITSLEEINRVIKE